MADVVIVVGIGADGWEGLSPTSRRALLSAEVIMGGARQLDLLPDESSAERVAWPSPLLPALPGLLDACRGRAVSVLASGDPLFHGIGGTLVRLLGADRVRVLPHPSSVSLACAAMGWTADSVEVVSAVGRPVSAVAAAVQPGRRVLVLSADGDTPALVARLLVESGWGASEVTVLEELGGPGERRTSTLASGWSGSAGPLNVVAVECRGGPLLPRVPGLPDEVFANDGQLTKREVRAIALSRLAPVPGQLLWDVGGGAGSVAVEWARTHPSCRATAVEQHAERAERITRNAHALGVPGVRVVVGTAPDALAGLEPPDAVFVGGGVTAPGLVQRCWDALKPGGRLVVNAVTLESEVVVAEGHRRLGGDLVRVAVQRASPVGGFTGWRPAMPVTTWTAIKETS